MDGAPVPQARGSFPTVLLFCIIIYMTTRSDVDPFVQAQLHDGLTAARHVERNYSAWLIGNKTTYEQEIPPQFLLPLRDAALPVLKSLDPQKASYWNNLTGYWDGPAGFVDLTTASDLPASWGPIFDDLPRDQNITGRKDLTGPAIRNKTMDVSLRISEISSEAPEALQVVSGHYEIRGPETFFKFDLEGLHDLSQGTLYAVAVPNGLEPDIRKLPNVMPAALRNVSAHAIARRLAERVEDIQKTIDEGGSDPGVLATDQRTQCQFYLFGHIVQSPIGEFQMRELEKEIRLPSGIPTQPSPRALVDLFLVSPECMLAIGPGRLEGLRVDSFWRKVTSYSGFAALVYLGLLGLLTQQMENARTPAAISVISRWAFVMQALLDAFAFTSHTIFGVMTKNHASLSMVAPGFLSCILALMFELRFTTLIHRVQAPEDAMALNRRSAPAAPPSTASSTTPSVTNQTLGGDRVTWSTSFSRLLNSMTDPDNRLRVSVLFWLALLVQLVMSPSLLLSGMAVLHSFWAPQIWRNLFRGTRKALRKRYVVGTSALRLALALYFFACPRNILLVEKNSVIYLLVGWVILQVLVLVGQEYLGASFFVPKGWITMPDVYDYHPNLISDPEAPEQNLGDCSICMEPIVVHPDTGIMGEKRETLQAHAGAGAALLINASMRRQYAFTPCSHIMHTACLEKWMSIKTICPSCRTPLPPL